MNGFIFLLLVFGLPAAVGFKMALSRGKNPFLWGMLCVFPFFLIVLYFEKPNYEIKGHFRLCKQCNETFPWKRIACKYCGAPVVDANSD
ncbi:MAG: hypothetical protein WCI45_13795 [Desulfuromonadales bacterium]